MLSEITKNKLANYIDVFCEKGYLLFRKQSELWKQEFKFGLRPTIYVNQFNSIGRIQAAVKQNSPSVDHLEIMKSEDIEALINTETILVALPFCSFFLGISYAPACEMIAKDLQLAIATDFNPGSTPSENMYFIVSTACIKMKMTPEEAINAATLNGAYTMGIS